jgi:hypothetical protein
MAPLLGGDLSRRVFLDRFASLCSDGLFHVRKICAANFGEFSAVVGQEITESVLVNIFEKKSKIVTRKDSPASCLAAAIGSDASQIRLVRPIGFPGAAAALLFDWTVQLADVESVSLFFSCLSSWRSFTLCAKTSCGESEKPAPKYS